MLCTGCSQTVKPIVALDIDGTLGDYHGHFEKFAAQWLGHGRLEDSQTYDGTVKYREWFAEAFGVTVDDFRSIKLAYRQGGLKRSMPVSEDAALVTRELREDGAEIWLVTTRPYLKLDGIDPDTRFWLERHGIQFDHLLYGPNKYIRLAEQVDPARVVACIDDDLNHLIEALGMDWDGILLRTKYNSGVSHIMTATSLYQAGRLVRMGLQGWTNRNDSRNGRRLTAVPTPEPAA